MTEFNQTEKNSEVKKSMPCESTNKTLEELQNDGWSGVWSFHTRFLDQWNQACDMVTSLKKEGWDVLLVNGQDEAERQDGVAYLYKKKLPEAEKKDMLSTEEIQKYVDALTKLHDGFEDRSILTQHPEIAKAMAERFTSPGLEVLEDLIKKLIEAKKE